MDCWSKIEWHSAFEPGLSRAIAEFYPATDFEGPARDLIHAFKFRGKEHLGRLLARRWVALTPIQPDDVDLILPIPMTYWKQLKRGFNPAATVAHEIGRMWGKPVITSVFSRKWWSLSQTHFDRRNRFRNAKRSFALKIQSLFLNDRNILLVDDVCTTGATLDTCARLLHIAGARKVMAAALARDH